MAHDRSLRQTEDGLPRRFLMVIDRRIIVLSDIHANASAFEAGVSRARSLGFDELIVLGDLLTYGCEVRRTLDLARDIEQRDGAKFILGNHDQIYFDYAKSSKEDLANFPPWIRESIIWTFERLRNVDLQSLVNWRQEIEFGNTLLAHANPFGYGNWAYLKDQPSLSRATDYLRKRSFLLGIFGHTHRHRIFISGSTDDHLGRLVSDMELELSTEPATTAAVTVASLGQPREPLAGSRILIVKPAARGAAIQSIVVEYDLATHLEAIGTSGMSEATVNKLRSYFR